MPLAETTTQTAMPFIMVNLICPDFWSRRSDYENQIVPFLKENRSALQLENAQDLLEAYIERVWPHDLPGSMIAAHASFDEYDRYILRPATDGPLADNFAVDGIVPVFGAYRKQGTLVVDRCILTAHIPPRPFERYVSGQFLTVIADQRMTQADFDALGQLSRTHETVRQRLQLWLECLEWQQKLTFIKQQDYRYEKCMAGDDGKIRFVVKDHKSLHQLRRGRNTFMMAASLTDSQNPDSWQPAVGGRVYLQRLGQLETIQFVDPDKLPFDIDSDHDLKDQKLAIIVIKPQDELLTETIPVEGFLLTSVGGDLKPIRSMRQAIERFMKGRGYNWFLPYWLFDIQNAVTPDLVQPIYHLNQPIIPLNNQQKAAVEKTLAAMDVMLLHGPPGTGKTACIAEICRQGCQRGWRILLVSQSNTAVDNAFLKLFRNPSLRPLRYGNPDRLEPEAQCFLQENILNEWFGSIRQSCSQRMHENRQLGITIQKAHTALEQLTSIQQQISELTEQIQSYQSNIESLQQNKNELDRKIISLREQTDINQRRQRALEAAMNFLSGDSEIVLSTELLSNEILQQQTDQLVLDIQKIFSVQTELVIEGLTTSGQNSWRFLRILRQALTRIDEVDSLVERMLSLCNGSDSPDNLDWSQLCRQLQLAWVAAFGTASVGQMEEVIASLSPSDQWSQPLSELKTFCQITAGPVRQMFEQGFERAAEWIHLILSENSTNHAKNRQQMSELILEKDRIDTEEQNISQKVASLNRQIAQSQQKWQELWPIACVDMSAPQPAPDTSKDALDRRQQQLSHWLQERQSEMNSQQKWDKIRQKWLSLLAHPSASQNQPLLELYISEANVIGATCLETGQRSFYDSNEFEPFDLVIVDEVSKATPIELLMPMMLGRRVVLVGDHRQLPPMYKERESSYTEALAEGEIKAEDFERFEELITASYFEGLFTQASDNTKQGLRVNYRGHSDIVQVCNPFYNGQLLSPEDIESYNRTKEHHLTIHDRFGGKYLEPHQHVLWVDSAKAPNGRAFYEKQIGSSKVNLLEVSLVMDNLKRLNQAVQKRGYHPAIKAKVSADENGLALKDWLKKYLPEALPQTLDDIIKRGRFQVNRRPATADTILNNRDLVQADTRMAVGVITFYGAQLGQIRNRIKQLRQQIPDALDCLDIRTNTVDKFQGMEMPIVLVSLVRSPRQKHLGQFVKEYRRINVAFSRAQKLLVIIGNSSAFRPATIELPDMDSNEIKTVPVYETIYQLITQKGGRRYGRQLIDRF